MAAVSEYAPGARRVSADEVARVYVERVQEATSKLPVDRRPKLLGILANDDPAARKYADWTCRTFKRDGLDFELRQVAPDEVEQALADANKDSSIHGLMIYYPVFGDRPCFHGGSYDDSLRDTVSLCKDAEGLCHFYRRTLYRNQRFVDAEQARKCVLPCTPLACVKILKHLGAYDDRLPVGSRLAGQRITVVNRSEVVGRPLAAMLANDGATVYSVDVTSSFIFRRGKDPVTSGSPRRSRSPGRQDTSSLAFGIVEPIPETTETLVRESDVVVLGVPCASYKMSPEWIKEGAIVINVASCKNIDETELLTSRPGVRFVPAVGKVTVAMLERNLLRLQGNFAGCKRLIWDSNGYVAPTTMEA